MPTGGLVHEPSHPSRTMANGAAPPRLLFVCGQPRFFSTHRLPLARAAAEAGYDVHIAVPANGPGWDALAREGFPLHDLAWERQGTNPLREARAVARLVALYGEVEPTIVHHVGLKLVLYGTVAARIRRVPAVVNAIAGLGHLYGSGGRVASIARWLARRALGGTFGNARSRVILQNSSDRDEFLASGLASAESIVMTVGSGVELERFVPSPLPDGAPIVMLAARMLWPKGVGEFVEAARTLRARGSDARFVLVGESDVNPGAVPTDQLARWHDEGIIEWWGHRDDMAPTLREATLVCLPSYYKEGCPKVLLEAAACGRPMVTTDLPGCRDVVTDGVEGRLIAARDTLALADAIAALLADPAACRRMGAAARARAEREFSVEQVARITLDTYRDLVPAPRRGRAA